MRILMAFAASFFTDRYFFTDLESFINLFELVEHYKQAPIQSAQFQATLGEAVQAP